MNKEEILTKIKENGYINSSHLHEPECDILAELIADGTLQTLDDMGVKFMNESYFYLLAGNPDCVQVIRDPVHKGISYLEKGKKETISAL